MQQLVNYYLDYRTSETNGEVRTILQVVNYCLIYRTSETPRLKVKKRKQGELLLGLRCLRNRNTWKLIRGPGELLPRLPYLRNQVNRGGGFKEGELPLDLRCLRNAPASDFADIVGELLLNLRYFRNCSRLQTAGRSGVLLLGLRPL